MTLGGRGEDQEREEVLRGPFRFCLESTDELVFDPLTGSALFSSGDKSSDTIYI